MMDQKYDDSLFRFSLNKEGRGRLSLERSRLPFSLIALPFALFLFLISPLLFHGSGSLLAQGIRLDSPAGGVTTKRIQRISGTVTGSYDRVKVVVNGIPQDVPVSGGRFYVDVVVSPGENVVEVQAGPSSDRVSFFANVPSRDIKIVLTWNEGRYIDLWVIDPTGERCNWSNPTTKSGGNLIANDPTGFGPQIFTMEKAIPGHYNIQVQNYSKGGAPVNRVKVYAVLYEGTPREKWIYRDFVMTKEQSIYHLADIEIEDKP